MNKNITCIILSGGKSSRMGRDKSFLKFGEITNIELTISLMSSVFSNIILITNKPDEYRHLNVSVFKDIYKEKGPLGGIHSGLVNSKTEKNFVISCDLPLMIKEVVEYIINFKSNKEIIICKADGYLQPLLGVYLKPISLQIENIFNAGEKQSLHSLLEKINHEVIEIEQQDFYKKEFFFNMNRPEDYQNIITKINPLPK